MFKIGKLYDTETEEVMIDFITHETYKIGSSTEKYQTLTFDISGVIDDKKYSFCFDLNCRLEKLLQIPQSETIDFKPYLFASSMFFTYDEITDMDPIVDIKVTRWLNNKFALNITFMTDVLCYNDDAYAGAIEFSFDLDDYLNKKK